LRARLHTLVVTIVLSAHAAAHADQVAACLPKEGPDSCRLAADLLERACKLGDAKACPRAEGSR
jgi:hypothetical protein